jgi:predicted metal-dependent phosphoesterase TrpH
VPCLPAVELGSKEQIELIAIFNEAQTLEYFYKRQVEPNRMRKLYAFLPCPLEVLLRSVTELGGLVSIPHPFGPLWKNVSHGKRRRPAIIRTIWEADCIEVWNGGLSKRANTKALKLCEQMGMIPLAGSDSHDPETIGSVLVAFKNSITSDNMFQHIQNSQISAILARNGRPRYLSNAWKIAKRHSIKFIFH